MAGSDEKDQGERDVRIGNIFGRCHDGGGSSTRSIIESLPEALVRPVPMKGRNKMVVEN